MHTDKDVHCPRLSQSDSFGITGMNESGDFIAKAMFVMHYKCTSR